MSGAAQQSCEQDPGSSRTHPGGRCLPDQAVLPGPSCARAPTPTLITDQAQITADDLRMPRKLPPVSATGESWASALVSALRKVGGFRAMAEDCHRTAFLAAQILHPPRTGLCGFRSYTCHMGSSAPPEKCRNSTANIHELSQCRHWGRLVLIADHAQYLRARGLDALQC